jgi:hypothetical protein
MPLVVNKNVALNITWSALSTRLRVPATGGGDVSWQAVITAMQIEKSGNDTRRIRPPAPA